MKLLLYLDLGDHVRVPRKTLFEAVSRFFVTGAMAAYS